MYEFSYSEAPSALRSIMQALMLVTQGAVSNALTACLSPLVPEDFNKETLIWYFIANLAMTGFFLVVFWFVAWAQGPFNSAAQTNELKAAQIEDARQREEGD